MASIVDWLDGDYLKNFSKEEKQKWRIGGDFRKEKPDEDNFETHLWTMAILLQKSRQKTTGRDENVKKAGIEVDQFCEECYLEMSTVAGDQMRSARQD